MKVMLTIAFLGFLTTVPRRRAERGGGLRDPRDAPG